MGNGASRSVPIAIVVAGIIIAGAIFMSGRNDTDGTTGQDLKKTETDGVQSTELAINPITQKDYIRGNPDAKVMIVEYSDTECPFCKKFHGTMKDLTNRFAKDGTMAWVYRHFPIKQLHPKAGKEAEALLCAGKVGGTSAFWDYTDRLYAVTPSNNNLDPAQLPIIAKETGIDETQFNACLSSGVMAPTVELDYQDAIQSGGNGTPYNVFVVNQPFDKDKVEKFLAKNLLQYRFPADLFAISNDGKRISVSGAMPTEFMADLIGILSQ